MNSKFYRLGSTLRTHFRIRLKCACVLHPRVCWPLGRWTLVWGRPTLLPLQEKALEDKHAAIKEKDDAMTATEFAQWENELMMNTIFAMKQGLTAAQEALPIGSNEDWDNWKWKIVMELDTIKMELDAITMKWKNAIAERNAAREEIDKVQRACAQEVQRVSDQFSAELRQVRAEKERHETQIHDMKRAAQGWWAAGRTPKRPKTPQETTKKKGWQVKVSNFHWTITAQEIEDAFGVFGPASLRGKVEWVTLDKDVWGQAIISFKDYEDALHAINTYDKGMLTGHEDRTIEVGFYEADPRWR